MRIVPIEGLSELTEDPYQTHARAEDRPVTDGGEERRDRSRQSTAPRGDDRVRLLHRCSVLNESRGHFLLELANMTRSVVVSPRETASVRPWRDNAVRYSKMSRTLQLKPATT
jgi:hypothetical protein